jgi:Effector Associated Constant Component 1
MDLTISAESARYSADDESWLKQSADLYQLLREEVPGCRVETLPPSPGTKGAIDSIIVSLGSAGAFTAVVECWRLWLSRDRSRRIALSWTSGDSREQIILEADGVNDATFAQLTETVKQRIAKPHA